MALIFLLDETIARMIEYWNEGHVEKVASFYSDDAVLFDDDDGHIVSGKNEIKDYLSKFEFTEICGNQQIKLNREQLLADGEFTLDSGTYQWKDAHNGCYLYKWQFQNGCWRMVAQYFTIEKTFQSPVHIHCNEENMKQI